MLELLVGPFLILCNFWLLKFNAILNLKVRNTFKVLREVGLAVDSSETTEMLAVVHYHAEERNKVDSDLNTQTFFLLRVVKVFMVEVKWFLAKGFKFSEDFVDPFLSFFALCHFWPETFLGISSWLAIGFSKSIFCWQLIDTLLVLSVEVLSWFHMQSLHFLDEFLHFHLSLVFAGLDHSIDLFHLSSVPFNFGLVIITAVFKEQATWKHVIVLLNQQVRLNKRQII